VPFIGKKNCEQGGQGKGKKQEDGCKYSKQKQEEYDSDRYMKGFPQSSQKYCEKKDIIALRFIAFGI